MANGAYMDCTDEINTFRKQKSINHVSSTMLTKRVMGFGRLQKPVSNMVKKSCVF
jgi:hypothetical protein